MRCYMIQKMLITMISLAFASAHAFAESGVDNPLLAPVQGKGGTYDKLKSPKAPDFSRINDTKETPAPVTKKTVRKKPLEIKPAKLNFDNVNIKGVISQPRLKFDLQELPVDALDEEIPADFLDKVFEEVNTL